MRGSSLAKPAAQPVLLRKFFKSSFILLCLIALFACQKQSLTFPVWLLFCMWCHFSSALQCATVFGLFRLGSVFTPTTTCGEHCLKASGILSAPQQKGKTSCGRAGAVPGAPSWHYLLSSLITAGRTSSPKTRKMTHGVVHAHHQRMDNSAPEWPTSKAPWLWVLLI